MGLEALEHIIDLIRVLILVLIGNTGVLMLIAGRVQKHDENFSKHMENVHNELGNE